MYRFILGYCFRLAFPNSDCLFLSFDGKINGFEILVPILKFILGYDFDARLRASLIRNANRMLLYYHMELDENSEP